MADKRFKGRFKVVLCKHHRNKGLVPPIYALVEVVSKNNPTAKYPYNVLSTLAEREATARDLQDWVHKQRFGDYAHMNHPYVDIIDVWSPDSQRLEWLATEVHYGK